MDLKSNVIETINITSKILYLHYLNNNHAIQKNTIKIKW